MQIKQLTEFADAGLVQRVTIARAPMRDGWIICAIIGTNEAAGVAFNLETQRGGDRVFTTCDAAVRTLTQLGLGEACLLAV